MAILQELDSTIQRLRAVRAAAPRARRAGVGDAHSDPGGDDRAPPRRPRRDRPGPDGQRQDRGLHAADPGAHRRRLGRPAGDRAVPDARAGAAGGRRLPRARRLPGGRARGARLRRRADPRADRPARPRRPGRRGHARPRARPAAARQDGARRLPHGGAGRGRRDAVDGLHRRHPRDPAAHAVGPPDGALLRDHAGAHPPPGGGGAAQPAARLRDAGGDHGRHHRPAGGRGRAARQAGQARGGAGRPSSPSAPSSSAAPSSAPPASPTSCSAAGTRCARCTAT